MKEKQTLLAPSMLSANFASAVTGLELIETSGADWVHLDVMDGNFVPNLSFGIKMVEDLRPHTRLPLDVHMMVTNPASYIPGFAKAGADYLTFHWEATVHVHRTLQAIRDAGIKPGISIVPSTPVETLTEVLPFVDLVLIMSVNPGFSGQKMIPQCLDKLSRLRDLRSERGYTYLLSIDGGINLETAPMAREKGADVLVSGAAFFEANDPKETAKKLKGSL